MSKDKNETPKKRSWLKRLFKFSVFLTLFFAVIFTVMANLGGANDMYRSAVEEFVSEATGYPASVKTLNNMTFFPEVGFDFEGVELFESADNKASVGSAKKISIALSFWDMAFQTGKLSQLHIEGVEAQAGVFMDKAVNIELATIKEEEGKLPKLFVTGHIDKYPVRATMDMKLYGTEKNKAYGFDDDRAFELELGEVSAKGTARNKVTGTIFEDLDISLSGAKVATGHVSMSNNFEGVLKVEEYGSVLSPNLKIEFDEKPTIISGEISSAALRMGDISDGSRFRRLIDYLEAALLVKKKNAPLDFSKANLDVKLDAEKFYAGDVNLGPLKLDIDMVDGVLKINPEGSSISSGKIKGLVSIDASASPAKLDININVKNMNYGLLQDGVSGSGNALVKLKATGKTMDAFKSNLQGQFSFTGGEGKFGSALANLWGRGVVNTILPSFGEGEALSVNCAIVDFNIENSIAKSNALFIDGTHVTFAGDGTYDIANDNLDIVLKPKQKEISIGDLSSALQIKGPLSKPSVSPSLLGLGKKVGGLLLGAVNPAFLAFSFADLGLSDSHPCASYIKAAEEK